MTSRLKIVLATALFAALSGTAAAHDKFAFSVTLGGPGYVVSYASPAPVYYAPPPVYYAPAPVYYRPRVYHYAPPVVVVHPKHHPHYVKHYDRRRGHR